MPKRRSQKPKKKEEPEKPETKKRKPEADPGSVDRPEIYTTIPPQPEERKPGQLSRDELEQYFEKGYVVVEGFFGTAQLDKVRGAVDVLVDKLADKLFDAGLIKDKYKEKTFFNRLSFIEKEFKGASVLLHKAGVLPQEVRDLWSDPRLLNVVEQLIGPEIAGHPVWNLRTKTPRNEQATVPWHQDNAYLAPSSLDTLQVTAWVPLIDANLTNGCIEVASGGHRRGRTVRHTCCSGGTWYVELDPKDMERELGVDLEKDLKVCEVPYGGVLLMNNAIPHRSLDNLSDIIRWSLDLRWQRPDHDNGFYGLKSSVLMRTAKDPGHRIDWGEMAGVDRTRAQMGAVDREDDDLKPEICGPWMRRWEVVHHNRHTARFDAARDQGNTNYHKA